MSTVGGDAMTKKSNLPLYKPPFSRDLTDLSASGVPNALCTPLGSQVVEDSCTLGQSPWSSGSQCRTGNSALDQCKVGNSFVVI